jgi:hypothetical protein
MMIDLDDNRLDIAKRFGATAIINASDGAAADAVMNLTGGRGVDAAIEAVGVPATFVLCEDIIAPRRHYRECRRAWRQGRPPSGTPVVAEHHDNDSTGRHGLHPHVAEDRASRED